MAKRKRYSFQTTIKNRLKQGRGTGVLSNYKPWLYIQDVPSKGLSTRIKGLTTGRIHHLLSKLELSCFLCLDWSEKVLDIREQYPLHLSETLAIAKKLNVKHPRIPKTQEDVVMTTDFLVTLTEPFGTRELAISIKYSTELSNPRSIKKLQIERFYWERRNIEWRIITENQINQHLAANIRWLYPYAKNPPQIAPILLEQAITFIYESVFIQNLSLVNITSSCDSYFNFEPGTGLSIVRYLIASRQLIVDLNELIHPEKTLLIVKNSLGRGI